MLIAYGKMRPYIMALDDLGDIHAEKGSVAWARAIRYALRKLTTSSETKVRDLQEYLKLVDETRGYAQLENPQGLAFATLAEFVSAPTPFGLGYDPEVMLHIQQETRNMLLGEKLREVQALQKHGANQHSIAGVDNIKSSSGRGGTSRHYLLARLKRDAPAIFAALARKEYRSARAAAKAAGLVQDPPPLQGLQRDWGKASEAEKLQFFREVRLLPSVGKVQ